MKVLQINIIKEKSSTGRTLSEMHNYLLENGVQSYVAYGHGKKPHNKNEYRIVNYLEYYFHNILARLFGTQGYHSRFATKRFISWIKKIEPDIIHIRNIRGNCLHNPSFFRFLINYNKPVILTTHDFWLLTGDCPIPKCNYWKEQCIYNPNCKKYRFGKKKLISKRFNDNKNNLSKINKLTVQANSAFSKKLVLESFLKAKEICTIYNWIDLNKFDFNKCLEIKRTKNNIKPRIQIVWSSIDDHSERFKRFIDFAKEYIDKYDFYVLGNCKGECSSKYPYINFVKGTNNIDDLLIFYSLGDILLNTSFFETFGKVVVESLACGTPAIVFNNGALPELIDETCGTVISPQSKNKEIDCAIQSLLSKKGLNQSRACRQRVDTNFNLNTNCKLLLNLYKKAINS